MKRAKNRLHNAVARLWQADAPLTGAGLVLLAALVVSLVGLSVDPRTIYWRTGLVEASEVCDLDRHL